MRARLRKLWRAPAGRWLPRRTVRMRLTALYGGLFLVAGALLLTITYVLVAHNVAGAASVSVTSKAGQPNATVVFGTSPAVLPNGAPGQGLQARSAGAVAAKVPPNFSPDHLRAQVQSVLDQQRSHELSQLLRWSVIALAIMALASVALGWLMAGRVLRPLRTMTATTRRISERNLYERLALVGPDDELKELGDTIDGLLARLEHAFDAQRRFAANASHELRTPLTLERAMIEVALADPGVNVDSLRSVCERVLATGEQQESLIAALLTLARGQRVDRREQLDLGDVVAAELRNAVGHRAPQVTASLDSAPVSGDPRLVERLVANLLDNAVRHNVPDGWMRVSTCAGGGRSRLRVINSGPVVAPGEEAELLEPFRRAAPERSSHGQGHGLGLSIAAAIAAAHDGTLSARARPEGGLEVEASFPTAAPPDARRSASSSASARRTSAQRDSARRCAIAAWLTPRLAAPAPLLRGQALDDHPSLWANRLAGALDHCVGQLLDQLRHRFLVDACVVDLHLDEGHCSPSRSVG
jgi:signal transduction histidine kinase